MLRQLITRYFGFFLALALSGGGAHAEIGQPLRGDELLRGRFVQERTLEGFSAPLRSEGSFVLAPGVGLIWRAETPFAVTTLMTRQGLAQQSDGATTLDLPASRAPFMATLYDMLGGALAGDWQGLERDFTVVKTEAGGKWMLVLTPRKGADTGGMPFAQINVTGAEFVERVEIAKVGGDRDVLKFLDQKRLRAPLTADEQELLQGVGQP
ncbi:MAG: outer membrane lipoprotein carrier protein LolA [Rhodospirillaceae bacterium]|nr:outer membrane lipoprotein carrier protein LolA [Rhodospirillaceae bacterium]